MQKIEIIILIINFMMIKLIFHTLLMIKIKKYKYINIYIYNSKLYDFFNIICNNPNPIVKLINFSLYLV